MPKRETSSRDRATAMVGLVLAVAASACGDRPGPMPDNRPWMQLSADHLSFQMLAYASDSADQQRVTVTNASVAELAVPTATVRYSGERSGWLTVGVSGGPSSYTVWARPSGVGRYAAGVYAATITLEAPGAGNAPTIAVELDVRWPTNWRAGDPPGFRLWTTAVTALGDGNLLAFVGTMVLRMDAASMRWGRAGALESLYAGYGARATVLADGRVFVTGGMASDYSQVRTWEIYDPGTNEVTAIGALVRGRYAHAAVRLRDGRVLIAGGYVERDDGGWVPSDTAEIFDPETEVSTEIAHLRGLPEPPVRAVLLADGQVLVTGEPRWVSEDGSYRLTEMRCERFDPVTESWTETGSMQEPRSSYGLALTGAGEVIAAGGYANGVPLDSSELYDPATGMWTLLQSRLHAPHGDVAYTTAPLPNGDVLVVGGCAVPWTTEQWWTDVSCAATPIAEVFEEGSRTWRYAGALAAPRMDSVLTVATDGTAFMTGGRLPDWADPGPEYWNESWTR